MRRSSGRLLLAMSLVFGLGGCASDDGPCGCLCAPQPDGGIVSPCSTIGPPVAYDGGTTDDVFVPE